MADPPCSELLAPPEAGRVFAGEARTGLADVAPSGRVRLDALACWLQDVAYADVADADVADDAIWVLRRVRLRVERFPRFCGTVRLRTYCTGIGRAWAERQTLVQGAGGAAQAVALWVHLDPVTLRPSPLSAAEAEAYGEAGGGRRVKARLRHPGPPSGAAESGWTFRPTEVDLARHVNNSAYWQPVEAGLLAGPEPAGFDGEMEFRVPAQPGEAAVLRADGGLWIVGADGTVHASLLGGATT